MSSVILQRSDNDGPRPKLVISGNDERTIAYLPDGRVVTGSWDGFVTVRNAENWTQEGTSMEQKNCMDSLTVTRDGTRIVTSNRRGSIKIWDVESHKLAKEWTHPETCLGVAISPNDLLIAVAADTVVFYAMEGIRVNHSIKVGENVWSMSFSPDGKKLACGSGNDIRVYDVERGTLVLGPLHGHEDNVRCMLWSRDGSRLFSASHDKMIRCWNSDTGEKIGHPWSGHTGQIRFLSLSPDGSILASASWDNTVRFWDTTGHPIGDHLQHGIGVNVVCFSPSGEFVASAGLDRKIYLWRVPYSLDSVESRAMNAPHNIGLAGGPFTTAHPITSSAVPISPPTPPIWDPNPHEKDFSETSAMVPPDMQYILPESTHQPQLLQAARSAPDLSAPGHPFAPSTQPHSSSTSPLAVELPYEMSALCPPPPDLTLYITRSDDQYAAGGGFGDVYRCRYSHDGSSKEVAVKAFRFTFAIDGNADDRATKMLRRELGIWRRLDHKNVVPFLGIAYGFGMRGVMSLVSLWMPNESLHHFLAKHDDNLTVGNRLRFLLEISNGLHYLHSFPIVHGDLNCNNVLLDADYTARLTDFGYSSFVGNIPEALTYLQRSTARPGALRWMAPEQIESEIPFSRTPKSDIYSFGCVVLQGSWFDTKARSMLILSQVLSGKQPWSEVQGDLAVVFRLAKGQTPGRPESRAIDDSVWSLIQDCWSSIDDRPATSVIISTIQRFLSYSPQSPPLLDSLVSLSSRASIGAAHVSQAAAAASDEGDLNSQLSHDPYPSGDL